MQLESDWDVHICGEAYSLDHGWTEGALQTADRVLTRFFGLPSFITDADNSKLKRSLDRMLRILPWP